MFANNDVLNEMLDYYSSMCDNKVVPRNFSLEPANPIMLNFLSCQNFINLRESNPHLKRKGSCIDQGSTYFKLHPILELVIITWFIQWWKQLLALKSQKKVIFKRFFQIFQEWLNAWFSWHSKWLFRIWETFCQYIK